MKSITHFIHKKTQLWTIFSGFWIAASILCLGSAILIKNDENLSRNEISFLISLSIVFCCFYWFIQRLIKRKKICEIFIICLALFLGISGSFLLNEENTISFHLLNQFEIEVLDLDPDAEFDVYWAYWAEKPDEPDAKIMDYQHSFDISYSRFEKEGDWKISEEGYLSTQSENAHLIFRDHGLRHHIPVLCLNTRNGQGTISMLYNGKMEFVHFTGKDLDPVPVTGYSYSFISEMIEKMILGFVFAGLFFPFLQAVAVFLYSKPRRLMQKYHEMRTDKSWFQNEFLIAIIAFALPICILLLVEALIGVFPFGQKTFLIMDMEQQYSAYLGYLKTFFTENNNLFYTFSKNLGGDMLSLFAYYLANPINFLTCLFSVEDFPKAAALIILLRFGLCGLTCNIFLRKCVRPKFSSIIFSTAYALMGYTLMNAENYFFIDGVIFLPLVLLGLEKIFYSHGPFLYVFSLAAIIFINFYFGYMICLFSFFYVIYRILISTVKQDPIRFKRVLPQYCLGTLLGIGLACLLFIPTIVQLSHGTKELTPDHFTFEPNFQLFDLIPKIFTGAYSDSDRGNLGIPVIFSGIFPELLTLFYFLNRNITRKEKLASFSLLAMLAISFHVRLLDMIWHGFNSPIGWPYRYEFLFSFVVIYLAYQCWCEISGITSNLLATASLLIIALGVLVEKMDYGFLTIKEIYADVLLCFFFCILIYFLNRKFQNTENIKKHTVALMMKFLIMVFSILNLAVNAHQTWSIELKGSDSVDHYRESVQKITPLIEKVRAMDTSFYRMEQTAPARKNDSMKYGYNGLSHYSSTTYGAVLYFLQRLGFEQIFYWNYYGNGSTAAVDSLLGIKYVISPQSDQYEPYPKRLEQNGIAVYQNPNALPLAFTVSNNILGSWSLTEDLFEVQNQMLIGMTDHQFPALYRKATVEKSSFSNPCWSSDVTSINEITWELKADSTDTLYAYFPAELVSYFDLSVNNKLLKDYFMNDRYGIIALGKFNPGESIRIRLRFNVKEQNLNLDFQSDEILDSVRNAQFYFEDAKLLETYFGFLKQESAKIEKISSSHLRGSVTVASEKRYLLFSIPYDQSWILKIDGKRTIPVKVFDALMAVKISPGNHSFEMIYFPEGLIPGTGITAVSLMIIVIWRVSMVRRQRKK
jgi:uncharacterized membrane protein YfhO